MPYFAIVVTLLHMALAVFCVVHMSEPKHIFYVAALAFVALFIGIYGAVFYFLDGDGISIWSLDGKKRFAWQELGAVVGREVDPEDALNPLLFNTRYGSAYGGQSFVRLYVVDKHNRVRFKISPWATKRRKLVKDIRERIRGARG